MELLIPRELFSYTYEDRQRLQVGLWRIMVTGLGAHFLPLSGTMVPESAYVRTKRARLKAISALMNSERSAM